MPERRPRLEGKVAIVTGAGSSGPGIGTGKATSVLFAREGAKVLLVDRVATNAEATLAAIRDEGGDASVCVADVINTADCQGMVDTARARYERLDILVNNVGILGPGSVVDVKEDDWERVLDVNLKSMMLSSKYAIPAMIEGGGGAIVNISSIAGLRAGSGGASLPYAVSKGGVIALTTQMAVHHGRDNIRVNGIAPGHIYTPMVAAGMTEEMRDLRRRAGPLGTEGTAWDIAWAAVFLASDEARWITGVVLPVDAGLLATTPLAMLRHLR
jgi:NAD(P)-dependent dehydrogenase (short-subunit alcohol dehydrogenase family)